MLYTNIFLFVNVLFDTNAIDMNMRTNDRAAEQKY